MTPVGGPRQFTGSGLGQIAGWQCPSCGADNSGPLEAGCQLCGSGQPGAHVGQAPPAAAERSAVSGPDSSVLAYEEWARLNRPPRLEGVSQTTIELFLRIAFMAGFDVGRGRIMDTHTTAAESTSVPALALPFPVEGKVARTLAAALQIFVDGVLVDAAEEIDHGEWCSIQEAKDLIAQLEAHTNG